MVVEKRKKGLICILCICLAVCAFASVALFQGERKTVQADAVTAQDIIEVPICDGAKGQVGGENAFDFSSPAAVTATVNYIHTAGSGYWNYDTGRVNFDISFKVQVNNWNNSYFLFRSSGNNEVRLYQDKIETALLENNAFTNTKSASFASPMSSGWHTVRLILDNGGATGALTTFTVKAYIDGTEYGYEWESNGGSGNIFLLINWVGSVNIMTAFNKDITEIPITDASKGNVGSPNAFDFNVPQAVSTGSHFIHTDFNYGQWDVNRCDLDINFQMQFADWGENGWIGFRTSGQNEIRIFNNKVEVEFVYNNTRTESHSFDSSITSGWHTVRLVLTDYKNGVTASHTSYVVDLLVDGVRMTRFGWLAEDWNGNAAYLINNTGTSVNVFTANANIVDYKKTAANAALDAVDLSKYSGDNLTSVEGIISDCKSSISGASTVESIEGYLADAMDEIAAILKDGIHYYNLSLEGDIGVQFCVYICSPAKDPTANGGLGYTIRTKDKVDYYMFTLRVPAKDYKNTLTLTVDDTDISGSASVAGYIDKIGSDSAAYSLVQSLKTYCEAARVLFDSTEAQPDAAAAVNIPDSCNVAITGSDPDITLYGATLTLETKTSINIYFSATSLEGKTLKVEKGEDEVAYTLDTPQDGIYIIKIENIAASDLVTRYKVTVGGWILNYGVTSYCYLANNNENSGIKTKNLAKALYNYSVAADDYFN